MIKIFMAGQQVPAWLQKITVKGGNRTVKATFKNPTVVITRRCEFYVRPIIGCVPVFEVDGEGKSLIIEGQSPRGGAGMVTLCAKPLLTVTESLWLLILIAYFMEKSL